MALEDTLEELNKTLATQNSINAALAASLSSFIEQSRYSNEIAQRFAQQSEKTGQQIAETSQQTADALQRLNTQTDLLGSTAHVFDRAAEATRIAADETRASVSEFTHMIRLLEEQLTRQTESLRLQNLAIQTEIKLAKESNRTSWAQNGIFFFLGVLIPVVTQIVFKFIH